MYIALDKNGNRVSIDQVTKEDECFCPACGCKLVQKRGEINAHHFAHPSHCDCLDSWHYDMSYWHYEWQNRFPVDCREVVLRKNNEIHRADVLIENEKIIIEFQHSPMSVQEFEERNNFYKSCGYKIVWLFDLVDQYYSGNIFSTHTGKAYQWNHAKSTFNWLDINDKNIELYFQFKLDSDQDYQYKIIKNKIDKNEEINESEQSYLDENEGDVAFIYKVTWISPNGMKYFSGSGGYDIFEFVRLATNQALLSGEAIKDLNDDLIEIARHDEDVLYYGCPKYASHLAYGFRLDDADVKDRGNCQKCKYFNHGLEPKCNYAFRHLGLNLDNKVIDIKRNSEGRIIEFTYISDSKTNKAFMPKIKPVANDIFVWWKRLTPKKAIFYNIRTHKYIKLFRDPISSFSKYHRVYGCIGTNLYEFSHKTFEIYGIDKKEWICVRYSVDPNNPKYI